MHVQVDRITLLADELGDGPKGKTVSEDSAHLSWPGELKLEGGHNAKAEVEEGLEDLNMQVETTMLIQVSNYVGLRPGSPCHHM